MASRAVRTGIVVTTLAVVGSTAGYWYWSPLMAVRDMQVAAKARDADAFNEHVDYPRLRENLKGEFSAMMARKIGGTEPDNDFARAGAAFGGMLGRAIADKFVEGLVRPEVVMQAMRSGSLSASEHKDPDNEPSTPPDPQTGRDTRDDIVWSSQRQGVDKYIAYAARQGSPDSTRVGFVLERSGFANWKLTEIRLPADS